MNKSKSQTASAALGTQASIQQLVSPHRARHNDIGVIEGEQEHAHGSPAGTQHSTE